MPHNAKGLPVINRKLTADQKRRGVIFSSALVRHRNEKDTDPGIKRIEVKMGDPLEQTKILNLKDTSYYAKKGSGPYRYNFIRT